MNYYATFSYVDFPAGTTFAVELSDQWNFTTPITTTGVTSRCFADSKNLKFAVPTNFNRF